MPALPNAAKILKIEITGTFGPASWANIFHARYAGTAPTPSVLDDFENEFVTAYVNGPLEPMHEGLVPTHIVVTDLTTTSSARFEADITGASGTNTGNSDSAASAAAISWKISRRYRGGHPRTYMCGLSDTIRASSTQLQPSFVTALQAGASSMLADVNAISVGAMGAIELGQLSYYVDKALRGVPLFDPFISASVNTRVDAQRRRLGR